MNFFHTVAAIAHKEAKAKTRGRRKDISTISQRATRIVEGASAKEDEDIACPRCDRELHVFNTASRPIVRCRGWNLAGTPCTLIKACQDGAVVPGGSRSTNRTGSGDSTNGGPGTLSAGGTEGSRVGDFGDGTEGSRVGDFGDGTEGSRVGVCGDGFER